MSSYSCTMPQRRAKDHKARLLVCSVLLEVAAWLMVISAFATYGLPVLFWLAAVAAVVFFLGSIAFFWVWWDVHHEE